METTQVQFSNRTFCFTGGLVGLSRSKAEQEARSRGAFTTNTVNGELDYLVVGSVPSAGWKFGNFGRKIEAALEWQSATGRPTFLPEEVYADALALTAPSNSGDLDAKVLVVTYKFTYVHESDCDFPSLVAWLEALSASGDWHVTAQAYYAPMYLALFSRDDRSTSGNREGVVVSYRFVRQLPMNDDVAEHVGAIANAFDGVRGVRGQLSWFERKEGTASYVRLLNELPQSSRLQGF